MFKGLSVLVALSLFLCCSLVSVDSAVAAEMKVGVMNFQKVLVNSVSGKAAKEKFDQKMQDLQSKLKAEEQELVGYRVKYRYKGRTFVTRTAEHPGDRIAVGVNVEPL